MPVEAFKLRSKYKTLTYFDSLHAAVAIVEDLEVVSYDRTYADLAEDRYIHPEKYVGKSR
ncbi:MAG: PIN domain-containing protein [Candidatus Bathyarchaeia archaeon]